MNLEALRRKRVKRMGIKSSKHTGQRRIFFVLDRATRRFPGDLALWMQYIEYARKESATKKLEEILTSALRMHPSKPEFWIYAAQISWKSEGDMYAARGYMQRGLRFCKSSSTLWLEYARLEMLYIAKIAARRKILGLDEKREDQPQLTADDPEADMIILPTITAEDVNPSLQQNDEKDEVALRNLGASPALAGAIPIVIYDTAMKQFQSDNRLAEEFFELFIEFGNVPCSKRIVDHVTDHILHSSPNSSISWNCFVRQPTVGVAVTSAEFPGILATYLDRLKEAESKCSEIALLLSKVIQWILSILEEGDIDDVVKRVLSVTLRQSMSKLRTQGGSIDPDTETSVVDSLRRLGFTREAARLQGTVSTELIAVV
jgi:U3 small nucleolar RNA-associated protein 6